MTRPSVAFVGLGAIGFPMAKRLAADDRIQLSLFDLSAEALESASAFGRVASSVADAISDADVIFSVLPADRHVHEVAKSVSENARRGAVYVDFSTIEPGTIEEISAELRERGVEVLGAALTKSVAAAEAGDLSIFLGGNTVARDCVSPLLESLATEVRMLETAGHAKALKVMNNMIVSGTSVLLCDAIVLGAACGIDPRHLATELDRRHAGSWVLENQLIKHVLTDELAPGRFSTAYMSKDAALAIAVAAGHGRPAMFAGAVRAAFRGSSALGFKDHYHPAVVRWFEHAALQPHIPFWGTPPEKPETDALRALADSVAVQQALLTIDALNLLQLEGIAPETALPHLRSGSAANAFIEELLGGGDVVASTSLDTALERIRRTLEMAELQSVPAWIFDTSASFAANQISLRGRSKTLEEAARTAREH